MHKQWQFCRPDDDGTGTLSDPGPEDSDGEAPPADKQIAGALARLPPQNPTSTTGCDMGMLDQSKIELFLDEGCGCSGHKGLLCSERFTPNDVLQFRSDCSEMTRTELDLVILGKLSATMSVMGSVGREHKHADRLRVRSRTAYAHQGWPICASMFRFLHTVGKKWLHCTCKN